MIVNTNPDFYKLFKSCVRWWDPSHTPAFLIIIIHEGGKPVKSETGFFWGEGGCFFVAGSTCRCCIRCGGLPDWSPADLAAVVSAGVACLLCRLLSLPLVVFVAPIPPTPFPTGRGRLKVYFAGATAPGTPALNRLRHSQLLPHRHPYGVACFFQPGFPSPRCVPSLYSTQRRKNWFSTSKASAASPSSPGMQGAKPLA